MHISYLDVLFKPINKYNDDSQSEMILTKALCEESEFLSKLIGLSKSLRHFCL